LFVKKINYNDIDVKILNIILGTIAVLSFFGLIFFFLNNYQISITARTDKPITIFPLPPQTTGKCGIQNCHGLDIVCGVQNTPQMCDMMYLAGDNCRQFASCVVIENQCILQKTPKFETCKACVEKCETENKNDSLLFFECESMCSQ
jgi:hypothetical protein